MPYAAGRSFCDADSHLMELPEPRDAATRPRQPRSKRTSAQQRFCSGNFSAMMEG